MRNYGSQKLTQNFFYDISIPPSYVTSTKFEPVNLKLEGTTMHCAKCQFDNPIDVKFCVNCGDKLETICPKCGSSNSPAFNFCGECGFGLSKSSVPTSLEAWEHETHIAESSPEATRIPVEGERKHVTVLFSDLSGYTAMSEKLDPEEVKAITSRIFGEISKIVANYDGFIEKYAGDAVMAIFGVPHAHEDDPIRAIKAAREIHQLVDGISPEVENKIGQSISMHTGINTGLVVTGEVDMQRGTHGIAGDTINLASRLSNLAKPGEIVVDVNTCHQIEGQFACEYMVKTLVKGKTYPVEVHKVLSQRDKPITIRRLSGLRAELVGRKVEMAELVEAVENLRDGKGRIISICGDAGTGKSRLVADFKAKLDLEQIQWIEGHSYAYSQNIPYFPLVDLLNRVFQVKENDPPETVREKVESGIEQLVGKKDDVVPYLGGLYSLSYPEVEAVSPDFWKSRLQEATREILAALANKTPTVFFLEDLHWADPSFVELLRSACLEIREPVVLLCVYRPTFSLFTGHQLSSIGKLYHEIRLQDLSSSDALNMLEFLLKTRSIPRDLKRFVQTKAEGNPFYLEELVNSLMESESLIQDNGNWKITKSITESNIPSSIHGLISGRLDRLQKESKRILQEASVIGRAFLYEILKKLSELKDRIDGELYNLERVDLIRIRTLQPDLEYMFKHPLTHEVVYNGLLKKERQEIHEQIALVMENLFQERLPEFYETLAFHFLKSNSIVKAIDYLMKSGEKSLKRYAVEESHVYYKQAYELLSHKSDRTQEEDQLLLGLLIKWAMVFYYRGDFRGLTDLLLLHEKMAEIQVDRLKSGMFYAWLGFALLFVTKLSESYNYLKKALKIGEEIEAPQIVGYASTWLIWTCGWLGDLDEALYHGKKAQEISRLIPDDHYLYFKSLAGLGAIYFFQGEIKKCYKMGKKITEYSRIHSNNRGMAIGYYIMGWSYLAGGDTSSAIEYGKKAAHIATDPCYYHSVNELMVYAYFYEGRMKEAEAVLKEMLPYCHEYGCNLSAIYIFPGLFLIIDGELDLGYKKLKETRRVFLENGAKLQSAIVENVLGRVFLNIVETSEPDNFAAMAKGIDFPIKDIPNVVKKAEAHFTKSIEISKEIGANFTLAEAYLSLGLLCKAEKRTAEAHKNISKAIRIYNLIDAEGFLKQAKAALATLR
jgi:class 3 adenylate cyclase/tetratricopeptide (TPR) repeat protein